MSCQNDNKTQVADRMFELAVIGALMILSHSMNSLLHLGKSSISLSLIQPEFVLETNGKYWKH